MAVLGDNPDCSERRGGAQDRADVMGVGDLIEHEQDGLLGGVGDQFIEPDVLKRLDFDNYALVRGIAGDEPPKVRRLRQSEWDVARELHEGRGFPRHPCPEDLAVGIVECSRDGMLAPESRPVGGPMALVRFLAARHSWRNAER